MMLGVYEHERDGYQFPTCWRVINNYCMPHFHSSIELVFVTQGELKVSLNGVAGLVKANQLLMVSSYMVHRYETVSSSEAIILIVPLDFIPSYQKLLMQNDFKQSVYQDGALETSELLHCLQILSRDQKNQPKPSIPIVKGYIYVILGMLIEAVGLTAKKSETTRTIAKDILIYLQAHYLAKVSLPELAQNFGYSPSRFSHIFNAYFSCTIADYVNSLRCRHASGLLSDETVSIGNAAIASGFTSMRTFFRSFKHCYGVTPSEYRDSYVPHSGMSRFAAELGEHPQKAPTSRPGGVPD